MLYISVQRNKLQYCVLLLVKECSASISTAGIISIVSYLGPWFINHICLNMKLISQRYLWKFGLLPYKIVAKGSWNIHIRLPAILKDCPLCLLMLKGLSYQIEMPGLDFYQKPLARTCFSTYLKKLNSPFKFLWAFKVLKHSTLPALITCNTVPSIIVWGQEGWCTTAGVDSVDISSPEHVNRDAKHGCLRLF